MSALENVQILSGRLILGVEADCLVLGLRCEVQTSQMTAGRLLPSSGRAISRLLAFIFLDPFCFKESGNDRIDLMCDESCINGRRKNPIRL